jgi:endo-1,4-beta-xylanase
MKRSLLPLLAATSLAMLCAPVLAQTNLLPANPVSSAWSYGCTTSVVSASGPGFTSALRVSVANPSANFYDSGIGWGATGAVNIGDRLRVTLYIRKISPGDGNPTRARLRFQTDPGYIDSLSTPLLSDSGTWQKCSFTVKATTTSAAGGAMLTIQCGYGPQTFEVGGISCQNLGPTPALPAGQTLTAVNPSYDYDDTNSTVTVTPGTVTGQPFTQKWTVASSGNLTNYYNAGLAWVLSSPLNTGDVGVLSFWARKVSPIDGTPTKLVAKIEDGVAACESAVGVDGTTWQRFVIPFKAEQAFAAPTVFFQYGWGPQTLEIGGVSVTRYPGASIEQISGLFPYEGRDASASWRAAAATRIDQNRRANFTFRVVDSAGNPLPGASVVANQIRHSFRLGSAIRGATLMPGTVTQDTNQFRSHLTGYFTHGTLENELKWDSFEDWSPQIARDSLSWLGTNGVGVRGHTLIWPGWDKMPPDCSSLAAPALRTRINDHISSLLNDPGVKDKCYQWDVLNEPYDNYNVQGILGTSNQGVLGNAEMISWFQQARQNVSTAQLFINDYDILEAGGFQKAHQDYYYSVCQYLINNGAPLDGIGIQGHFVGPSGLSQMQNIFDRFSGLGKRMAITEFDFKSYDDALQADFTRDFLTFAFSQPALDDFIFWGFWEGAHWKPDTAMLKQDWSSRASALAFTDLVYNQWTSNGAGQTNGSGNWVLRGFKGGYNVRATLEGASVLVTPSLNSNQTVTLTLPGLFLIYGDALSSGWSDSYSWNATRNLANTSPVRGTRSIAVTYTGAGGLGLRRASAASTSGVGKLKFWVHGGTGATKALRVSTQSQDTGGGSPEISFSAPAGTWTEITVNLSSLGSPAQIKRINLMSNATLGPVYFDDIRLVP